ncbi:MAG: hypothetical protein JWO76_1615 [Nocardioides sp.]|nr:hypothetical protein [Nocardioides sp.]
MSRLRILPALLLLAVTLALPTGSSASTADSIEDYARYQPQTKCRHHVRPGMEVLAHWLVRRYGGGYGPTTRPCRSGGTSEHKDGRAFDWTLDAAKKQDRKRARAFLDFAFAEDAHGNADAKARRMGIMYVIWNDTMYPAWHEFEPEPYLSSGCESRRKCSKTLRHRDHLHVSLSRPGGRGDTSWYDGRVGGDS